MSDLSVPMVSGTKIATFQINDITQPPLVVMKNDGALPHSNIYGHKGTGDIIRQSDLWQSVDTLIKVARPEQGAFFTGMINTMGEKSRPIMVGWMARHINQSPPTMTECLESRSLRRAFIAELRNPIYHACAEIQAFRNKLLIQHYQCELLRDDVECEEAFKLLKTLPAEKLLDLQVVVNQVAEKKPEILNFLTEIKPLSRLISCAKLHAEKFPHIFINTNKQEVICLTEHDCKCFITVCSIPEKPQIIRYNSDVDNRPVMMPAKPEDLSEMRSSIPLLKTRWKRETFSWRPIIYSIFGHRDGFSYHENARANHFGLQISGHDSDLVVMVYCQIPANNLIVHFL